MKTLSKVEFAIGVGPFITSEVVTKELIVEYIETVSPGVYYDLRIENDRIIYNDDEYDYTTNVEFLVSTVNLFNGKDSVVTPEWNCSDQDWKNATASYIRAQEDTKEELLGLSFNDAVEWARENNGDFKVSL